MFDSTGSPMMLIGSLRAAAVTRAAHTVAAPPMSALIASIPDDGLREIPPLRRDDKVKDKNIPYML